jgi:hypothetical protein
MFFILNAFSANESFGSDLSAPHKVAAVSSGPTAMIGSAQDEKVIHE